MQEARVHLIATPATQCMVIAFAAAALVTMPSFAHSAESPQDTTPSPTLIYLRSLSLEELANVDVFSASRKEEAASAVAATVHVITEEDIRRSGARSIPEALRLAPNLQVARATSRTWAISARGFTAPFSNKLLVLIDGRTVYSPLFAGVFWDAQDTLLEDIDRIEVISGPGATMWGANAVNGVINIITKSAQDTQGVVAAAGAGSEERVLTGVRYGGKRRDTVHYRAYAKYFDRDHSLLENGASGGDAWHSAQAGGRLDWKVSGRDLFTLHGDVYGGRGGQLEGADISHSGGNLLARWTRSMTDTEQLHLQSYYDRTHQIVPGECGDDLDTFDLDAQYERDIGARHHLMIGGGYRFTHDRVQNVPGSIAFLPPVLDRHLFSAFVQDDVALTDSVRLTIGSKFEHNDYTGLELQPSGRLAATRGRHLIWSAVSRAVRTPSRFDRHLFFPAEPPFIVAGGPSFDSERVMAYELGWRVTAPPRVVVSLATFFNDYDDIRSTSAGPPFVTENNVEGTIHGAELEATWQASRRVRMIGGYTVLREDLRVKPGAVDVNAAQGETFDPKQQFQVRSSLDLPRNIELDVWARYVGQVGNTGRRFAVIPRYFTLDARVGWSPVANVQVAVVGQHLLDDQHREFGNRELPRAAYVKVTWRR